MFLPASSTRRLSTVLPRQDVVGSVHAGFQRFYNATAPLLMGAVALLSRPPKTQQIDNLWSRIAHGGCHSWHMYSRADERCVSPHIIGGCNNVSLSGINND